MRVARLVVTVSTVLVALVSLARDPITAQQSAAQARRDGVFRPERELATTVRDGFTMAVVGDMIIAYPLSQNTDPAFHGVLKLIRDADVATGNYEGNIIDGRKFKGAGPGGFAGVPEVAADIKAMGWDLVARSNNHIGEYGYEGLLETNRHLDEADVMYAGSGESYWAARAPRFVASSRGRVGMVATASSFSEAVAAEPGRGEWPGRGGQSALRTTRFFVVPDSMWQSVKNIREAFPNGMGFYVPRGETDSDLTVLGQRFRRDPKATKPYYSFRMDERDLKDILSMVTEGKVKSDLMTVAIHSHQFADTKGGERGLNLPDSEDLDTNTSIADFLKEFAHATIDAGADVFQGTGVHVLRGIEIYKGRPIFYGLGEFFRQMDIVGLAAMGPRNRGESNSPPIKYESIVAITRFDRGALTEVQLHPIELTDDVRMAHRGIPRTASTAMAERILTRLQRLSEPLGTTITIQNNIGYIRPKPTSTASVRLRRGFGGQAHLRRGFGGQAQ